MGRRKKDETEEAGALPSVSVASSAALTRVSPSTAPPRDDTADFMARVKARVKGELPPSPLPEPKLELPVEPLRPEKARVILRYKAGKQHVARIADVLPRRVTRVMRTTPQLRHDAALTYMSDPRIGSAAALAKLPRFEGIRPETLSRWCAQDRWVERREEYLSAWTTLVQKKTQSAAVERRAREIESLLELDAAAMTKLRGKNPDGTPVADAEGNPLPVLLPRSWEGVANVKLAIGERLIAITEEQGRALGPPQVGEEESLYSDAELEAMTKALLAERRAGLEAGPPAASEPGSSAVPGAGASAGAGAGAGAGVTIDVGPDGASEEDEEDDEDENDGEEDDEEGDEFELDPEEEDEEDEPDTNPDPASPSPDPT